MPREAVLRRRPIRTGVRAEVIARDGLFCRHCGRAVRPVVAGEPYRGDELHLDHLAPWALGGSDEADNLVVSCSTCNLARPRPAGGSAAEHRLLWRRDGDDFYWRDRAYRPPMPVNYGRRYEPLHFPPIDVAEILNCTAEDVIQHVTTGVVRGTTGTRQPIQVVFHSHFAAYVEQRMDELGWEE